MSGIQKVLKSLLVTDASVATLRLKQQSQLNVTCLVVLHEFSPFTNLSRLSRPHNGNDMKTDNYHNRAKCDRATIPRYYNLLIKTSRKCRNERVTPSWPRFTF